MVVQSNVVLTAAHLVFKDDTLSYVSAAYWFPQEEVPSYIPTPLIARGEYLLSGYAAQRTNDLSSGIYGDDVSSPQSRELDVAALYFGSALASGGYGGYLPSDTVPNQWLTSTAQKMLAGYPVDGSLYGFTNIVAGQMYQIGPQPFPLDLSPDLTPDQQEIYTASWFLSYPGNSGGPLYVQLNGYYYPAGVYLGTLNNQSVVRGIDSNVVNLVTLAATLGDNGTNYNGGGVIQLVSNEAISAVNAAYLQIQNPAAVRPGGSRRGMEKLQTDSTYANTPTFTRAVTLHEHRRAVQSHPGLEFARTNQKPHRHARLDYDQRCLLLIHRSLAHAGRRVPRHRPHRYDQYNLSHREHHLAKKSRLDRTQHQHHRDDEL